MVMVWFSIMKLKLNYNMEITAKEPFFPDGNSFKMTYKVIE